LPYFFAQTIEISYISFAAISAQKNASFPVKVSPHSIFDLPNQNAASFRPLQFCKLAKLFRLGKRKNVKAGI
jgi:hypothetical protein